MRCGQRRVTGAHGIRAAVRRIIGPLSGVLLATGCAGGPPSGVPLGVALASCSTPPAKERMVVEVPQGLSVVDVARVRVHGPADSGLPPPVSASSFQWVLERALRDSGALAPDASLDAAAELDATLVQQERHVTLLRTELTLTVKYELRQPGAERAAKELTITTSDAVEDWKQDACKRLRLLQERLVRVNVERMLSEFLIPE